MLVRMEEAMVPNRKILDTGVPVKPEASMMPAETVEGPTYFDRASSPI